MAIIECPCCGEDVEDLETIECEECGTEGCTGDNCEFKNSDSTICNCCEDYSDEEDDEWL